MGFNSNISFAVLINIVQFSRCNFNFDEVGVFFAKSSVFLHATSKKNTNSRNLVGSSGIEPPTSRLSGVRSNRLSYEPTFIGQNGVSHHLATLCGGDEEDRTPDPLLARQVLSQLSYTPISLRSGGL